MASLIIAYRSNVAFWHKTEVPPPPRDFRFWGLNGHSKRYGRFKPQSSLLMLFHPLAGHALGFGDLGGRHVTSDDITVFRRVPVT